jgi:hypothetical protein
MLRRPPRRPERRWRPHASQSLPASLATSPSAYFKWRLHSASYLAVTRPTIQASQHNPPLLDIAAALTARLSRDRDRTHHRVAAGRSGFGRGRVIRRLAFARR